MLDLNSVLLEGIVTSAKPKRDRSGLWVELRNRRNKSPEAEGTSHHFRIEVRENLRGCPPAAFTIGSRIRVVGSLRRAGRLGPFISAEHVEFKAPVGVMA